MPHLILEMTPNVESRQPLVTLFHAMHAILADTGGIALGNCKSRAYVAEDYLVADGSGQCAFLHLDVSFLEGRTDSLRQQLGRELCALLVDSFGVHGDDIDFQITVELRDIQRAFYFKHPAGTL